MNGFFDFRKMITPAIIKYLFFLGVIACVFLGGLAVISGIQAPHRGGMEIFMGLIIIVLGPIMIRITCETIIVVFSINDSLLEVKKRLMHKAALSEPVSSEKQ